MFQLAFPVAVATHFHRRGHLAGAAAGAVWLGESLLNVARYMADARSQALPLVGGGDHDWAEIFGRWHILHLDTRVAGLTRFAAVLLMAATVLVNLAPPNPYFAATLKVWQQGHFLNFNGLTHLVSAAWPFAALGYLVFLAAAGRRKPAE